MERGCARYWTYSAIFTFCALCSRSSRRERSRARWCRRRSCQRPVSAVSSVRRRADHVPTQRDPPRCRRRCDPYRRGVPLHGCRPGASAADGHLWPQRAWRRGRSS